MFKLIKTDIMFSRNRTSIGEKKFSLLLQQAQQIINILVTSIRSLKKKLLTFPVKQDNVNFDF